MLAGDHAVAQGRQLCNEVIAGNGNEVRAAGHAIQQVLNEALVFKLNAQEIELLSDNYFGLRIASFDL